MNETVSGNQMLKGRHVLVTGIANRWSIAWAVAEAVLREGGAITLTYQGETQLGNIRKILADIPGGDRVLVEPLDVCDEEQLKSLCSTLEQAGIFLDGVVHSIAFALREELDGQFVDTSRKGYLLAQEISAFSLVALSKALLPRMNDGGAIVAMTYLGSERVVPHYNVMGVAKAALESAVRYLAYDLGGRRIRVNSLSAGPVKTASGRAIKGFGDMVKTVSEQSAIKDQLTVSEVADVAVSLLSPYFRGVTGELVHVDMGYHALGMVLPSSTTD